MSLKIPYINFTHDGFIDPIIFAFCKIVKSSRCQKKDNFCASKSNQNIEISSKKIVIKHSSEVGFSVVK